MPLFEETWTLFPEIIREPLIPTRWTHDDKMRPRDSRDERWSNNLFFQVNLFKDYIAQAFPDGDDLILDSEVLMVDNETGQPLPFGTLGIHKVRASSFVTNLFFLL